MYLHEVFSKTDLEIPVFVEFSTHFLTTSVIQSSLVGQAQWNEYILPYCSTSLQEFVRVVATGEAENQEAAWSTGLDAYQFQFFNEDLKDHWKITGLESIGKG